MSFHTKISAAGPTGPLRRFIFIYKPNPRTNSIALPYFDNLRNSGEETP